METPESEPIELVEQQEQPPQPGLPRQVGRFLLRALSELVSTILPAVLIALVINLFLAQATVVQGQSMEPNLHNEERLIVEKVTYQLFHGPRRGDVVVLQPPGQDELLIKRVIALPGETIQVQNGVVYINGEALDEPWVVNGGGPDYPPAVVPPLHIFVMGDNRGHSNDSRSFGPVPIERVIGHAWFIYWPPQEIGPVR
jgi:signal peptidase I